MALLGIVALVATACGAADSSAGGPTLQADVPLALTDDVTDGDLAALVAGDAEFAFDVFHLIAGEENAIFSPYGLSEALTMTYAGTRGPTADEIRAVLHISLNDERLHRARNAMRTRVGTEADVPEGDLQEAVVRVANSPWVQRKVRVVDSYLELLAAEYDAGVNVVDFAADPDEAARAINHWVSDQTMGRIDEMVNASDIDVATLLMLVNAVWFKANWRSQFSPNDTSEDPFTTLGGTVVNVPTMHSTRHLVYVERPGYKATRLGYRGEADMVLIVPDPGRFAEVAGAYGPDDLAADEQRFEIHLVTFAMPKFEFRSNYALEESLQDLGIVKAFGGADFSGMFQDRGAFIGGVKQEAFVAVDERGTEAAAVTGVTILSSAPPPATVIIDRPFLFLIKHRSTGEILFVGQVTDPSA